MKLSFWYTVHRISVHANSQVIPQLGLNQGFIAVMPSSNAFTSCIAHLSFWLIIKTGCRHECFNTTWLTSQKGYNDFSLKWTFLIGLMCVFFSPHDVSWKISDQFKTLCHWIARFFLPLSSWKLQYRKSKSQWCRDLLYKFVLNTNVLFVTAGWHQLQPEDPSRNTLEP